MSKVFEAVCERTANAAGVKTCGEHQRDIALDLDIRSNSLPPRILCFTDENLCRVRIGTLVQCSGRRMRLSRVMAETRDD